jgi:hypothetical protein
MNRIPHHTSKARGTYYSEWGTPTEVLQLVRDTFGRIDLDLCSSAKHNKVVGARNFFTKHEPCPSADSFLELDMLHSNVWCNPPGPSGLVIDFWRRWLACMAAGANGAFLIFNLDHWRMLVHPTDEFFIWIPRYRLKYMGAPSQASFPSGVVFTQQPKIPHGHLLRWGNL